MENKYPHTGDFDFEKEAPLLSSLKGKPLPFEIPEDYFESFTDRVMNNVRMEEGHASGFEAAAPVRRILLVNVAAVLALLVLFASSVFFSSRGEQLTDFSQLSSEEILLALDVSDFDEELLTELMGDEALASLVIAPQMSKASISEYLEEEDLWEDFEFDLLEDDLDWFDPKFSKNDI